MRRQLLNIVRRLVRALTPSRTVPPSRPTACLRAEELEERLALSAMPGAAAPMACQCPCCAGAPAAYTLAQNGAGTAFASVAKWSQPGGAGAAVTITYSFSNLLDGGLGGGLSAATIRSAIQEALGRWAAVAPLRFVEVADSGPAPGSGDYGATGRPMLRFGRLGIDGAYNTLAYAYYPGGTGLAGDVLFDTAENWKVNPRQGVDLIEVATHEVGHALGLGHEPMPQSGGQQAIMNPYYGGRYNGPGTSYLLADDINGIRALYGAGTGSVTPRVVVAPGDANVVRSYYQRALGRAATDAEVNVWLNVRAQGTNWESIAGAIANSTEANVRVVNQYYQAYLGRAAGADSQAYWSWRLATDLSREQFATILLSCAETNARYATNQAWVSYLYATTLGRQGTSAEQAASVQALNAGLTREQLAGYFTRSTEAYARQVNAVWQQYLDRTPDATTRNAVIGLLTGGTIRLPDIAVYLMTTAEYLGRND